jgi:hypothetical protein
VLPASLAQGKSVDVAYMKVKEIGQEAYRCNKIESGITGTDNFYVERPSLMKTTLLNRTIDAVNITYVYDASYVARSASDGVASEAQILIDRLNINDVLLCVKIPDKSLAFLTGGDPVNATYADMNVDGRYWARRDVD